MHFHSELLKKIPPQAATRVSVVTGHLLDHMPCTPSIDMSQKRRPQLMSAHSTLSRTSKNYINSFYDGLALPWQKFFSSEKD